MPYKERVSGWLCPDGQFIQCPMYEHLDILNEHDIFFKKVPKALELMEELEAVHQACQDLADREGHHNGEWHCYEMATDRIRPEIWRLVLNAGFIRVGESDDELYFEGRPNVLKSRHQACVDLAESYGTKANFEPKR